MKMVLAFILLAFMAGSTLPCLAQTATLERLANKAAQVRSIQCDFIQEKRLSIFDQTIIAKGRFAFERPGSLRWEYTQPMAAGFILSEGKGLRWNRLSGEEQTFTLDKDPIMQVVAGQIVQWTTLNLAALSRTYGIVVEADKPAVLRLTPHSAKGPIAYMRISFTPDDASIATIELADREGDTTTLRFQPARLNEAIPSGMFDTGP